MWMLVIPNKTCVHGLKHVIYIENILLPGKDWLTHIFLQKGLNPISGHAHFWWRIARDSFTWNCVFSFLFIISDVCWCFVFLHKKYCHYLVKVGCWTAKQCPTICLLTSVPAGTWTAIWYWRLARILTTMVNLTSLWL